MAKTIAQLVKLVPHLFEDTTTRRKDTQRLNWIIILHLKLHRLYLHCIMALYNY